MYEAIIAVGSAVYGIFQGSAKKRKATRASVIAFWDPIFGSNNYPPDFDRWLFGSKRWSGTRRAKRGARQTNAIIGGEENAWTELFAVLGDDMPTMEFWAQYLGWPSATYPQNAPDLPLGLSGVTEDLGIKSVALADNTNEDHLIDDKKNIKILALILGAFLTLKFIK